jgi:hypothetical protein
MKQRTGAFASVRIAASKFADKIYLHIFNIFFYQSFRHVFNQENSHTLTLEHLHRETPG